MTTAATGSDVAAAQTAAAVEHLTISVYNQVAQLPVMQSVAAAAGTTISAFFIRTAQHHADHVVAFNAAAVRLGGQAQTGPDRALLSGVVQPGMAAITTPVDALDLIAKLELIAAETYAAQAAVVSDAQLRASFASIAGVECQHQAVLLAMAALLGGARADLVAFPWDASLLPPTAPAAGTPVAFLKTDAARPTSDASSR